LKDVHLGVGSSEQLAVIGPSGAGKTTLLHLLNGSLRPEAGEVHVDGRPLSTLTAGALREIRSRVGFVHQHHCLVPNLRVVQNVVAGRLGRRGLLAGARSMLLPSRSDLMSAHAILERVGIPDLLYRRTDTLSGGQLQRVAIARALFQDPVAIIADEPVASVDPARARSLIALLCEIARERGITLVASLHDLELARAFFGRAIGLREGRVLFDAPVDAISSAEMASLYQLEDEARDGP
jgi:phosphonate transport system ATP-binding protein